MFLQSHSKWLQTVSAKPEAILFKFVPITSLLTGIPGSGYLSHAINLYLRCKCSNAKFMEEIAGIYLFIYFYYLTFIDLKPLHRFHHHITTTLECYGLQNYFKSK